MYRGLVTNKFKQRDNLSGCIQIILLTEKCINEAKYNLHLCFTPYYSILTHDIFA
jgi:hypothetical protein